MKILFSLFSWRSKQYGCWIEMHVPTSFSVLTGSRRPSSSSMHSGLSFRTQSSFRGYRYYSRDPVRRTLSSPAESSPQYAPTSPCKVPHHNHPLHHNSPVDDEDIMDVSKYIFCSSSIWRTKYVSLSRYNTCMHELFSSLIHMRFDLPEISVGKW